MPLIFYCSKTSECIGFDCIDGKRHATVQNVGQSYQQPPHGFRRWTWLYMFSVRSQCWLDMWRTLECSPLCFTETCLTLCIPSANMDLPGFITVRVHRQVGKRKVGGLDWWCNPGHVKVKTTICCCEIELLALSLWPDFMEVLIHHRFECLHPLMSGCWCCLHADHWRPLHCFHPVCGLSYQGK